MPVTDDVKKIQDGDNDTGWAFFNHIKTTRTASKADLVRAKNELANELIVQETKNRQAKLAKFATEETEADIEREIDLKIALHQVQLMQQQADKFLLENATKKGLRVDSDQQLLVFGGTEKIRVASDLELEKGKSQIRIIEDDEASIRKVFEHHQMSQIDIHKDYQIRMNQLQGIVAFKLISFQKSEQARKFIFNLMKERDGVNNSDLLPESKEEYIDLLNDAIKRYKEAYVDGEHRLLQTSVREDMGGRNEDTDL